MALMDMRGSLNVSQFKTKENQPKYYGRACIEGVLYDIKGWEKDGPKGPWISILFETPKSEEEKAQYRRQEFAPDPKPLNPVRKNYVTDDEPF